MSPDPPEPPNPGQPPADPVRHRDDLPTSAHASASSAAHAGLVPADFLGESPGDVMGNYQLLRVLGEGGFGVVWLAMQREPIIRQVALKVLKPGMDSRQVLARFEQERQALALMDHPNVAKVFDAGATPTGRPYFVMEFVQGTPITTFADQRTLSLRQRLELFLPVCDAIQHAHVKGIIHRDIKPSNVLVEIVDERPSPKVIDFGVAKAVEHALTDKTLFTETGQIVGTPEYMSPEQADADHRRVDTRTDVYSLGVLLYELLTGALPFDAGTLRSAGYKEIQRIIREVDPPRPSTRLSGLGAMATLAAENRKTRTADLSGILRQELEWIPLRAMRKEPEARYQSPADLARDVRAYLEGLPLAAGPETRGYRVRKFVKRHKAGVSAGAVMAALLLAGVGALGWGLVQNRAAYHESERANKEAAKSLQSAQLAEAQTLKALEASRRAEAESRLALERLQHTSAFLGEVLALADPTAERRFAGAEEASAEDVTVRTAVEAAASRLDDGELSTQPLVEADIREIIGETFTNLGYADRAREQLTKVAAIRQSATPPDDVRTAVTQSKLARLELQQQNLAAAKPMIQRALELLRSQPAAPRFAMGRALALSARLSELEGDAARAREQYAEAIDTLAPEATDRSALHMVAEVQSMLGVLELRSGNAARAVELQRDAASTLRRLRGELSGPYAATLTQLGAALRQSGNTQEAERTLTKAIDAWTSITPSGSSGRADAQAQLARLLLGQSRFSQAEPLTKSVLEFRRKHLGSRSIPVADSLDDLGMILRASGLLDEAIGAYREALAIRQERQGPDHVDTAILLVALSDTLTQSGRPADALPLAERAVELRQKAYAPTNWSVMSARSVLGGVLVALDRFDEAEPHLLAAEESFSANTAGSPKRLIDTRTRLVALYQKWNKPEQAATWRAKLLSIQEKDASGGR